MRITVLTGPKCNIAAALYVWVEISVHFDSYWPI